MLDQKNLFELARVTARAQKGAPTAYSFGENKFSYAELNDTLRNELNEYAGTPALYRENKNTIFSLMEVIVDEVLPVRVLEAYGQFAEIKQFGQGEKAVFTQKVTAASRRRAKQFITKVGLAGVYEVFKLDGRKYELEAVAYGGAAQISIEEFLDGRLDLAEILDIVMEGINESIYKEIANALIASVSSLGSNNFASVKGFDESVMDKLLAVADAYGKSTIYCTYEFAATMLPAEAWASNEHKNQRWNTGYISTYKAHNVVVLPQSFEDENNSKKVIDPSYAYIIPVGAEKPVKVAFEGQTLVKDVDNDDWSKEVRVYKKVAVGTIITNNICVYQNSELA